MWSSEGWTKSVHNSGVSTVHVVKLGVAMGRMLYKNTSMGQGINVHSAAIEGCPQGGVLPYV